MEIQSHPERHIFINLSGIREAEVVSVIFVIEIYRISFNIGANSGWYVVKRLILVLYDRVWNNI